MAANVGNELYIPSKIRVGYQNRSDTYTKKLAYVIYYDGKGQLRKQKSWDGWRDKKIEPEDFDNVPHSGFVLNKDVKRSSEWFSSGRNMIRVYDDRGIEFEITTGNLLFILMTTDCMKRGLTGEFVYAWQGTELVLLPVGCDEYQNSVKHTEMQHSKVSAKALVPGCSYKTRKGEDYIYLGRFDWLDRTRERNTDTGYVYNLASKKKHVFVKDDGKDLRTFDPSSLAFQNTTEPISNYADLVEVFTKSARATKPVELVTKLAKSGDRFYVKSGNSYKEYTKQERYRDYYWRNKHPDEPKQYYYHTERSVWMDDNGVISSTYAYGRYNYYSGGDHNIPADPVGDRVDLYVKLASGSTMLLKKYFEQFDKYWY
jgi:hypothetical protein